MGWRHKDWKNPWESPEISNNLNPQYGYFEAGADAMLEALIKDGIYGKHHSSTFSGLGWVVFIPEKEK